MAIINHSILFCGTSATTRVLAKSPAQYAIQNIKKGSAFKIINCRGKDITLNALACCSESGEYDIIETPEWPAVPYIIGAVLAIGVALLYEPDIPNLRDLQNERDNLNSSVSRLDELSNKARPLQRIPSIFGYVRTAPDLLSKYRYYIDGIEEEVSVYSVALNRVIIESPLILGEPIDTDSAGIRVFQPGQNIDSGTPDTIIGISPFPRLPDRAANIDGSVPIKTLVESKRIEAATDMQVISRNDITRKFDTSEGEATFYKDDQDTLRIVISNDLSPQFPVDYVVGEAYRLEFTNEIDGGILGNIDLDANFLELLSINGNEMTFDLSNANAAGWAQMPIGQQTLINQIFYIGTHDSISEALYTSWIYIDDIKADYVVFNFVAPNGVNLQQEDGTIDPYTMTIVSSVQLVDPFTKLSTGSEFVVEDTITRLNGIKVTGYGSREVGATYAMDLSDYPGSSFRIRFRRSDFVASGQNGKTIYTDALAPKIQVKSAYALITQSSTAGATLDDVTVIAMRRIASPKDSDLRAGENAFTVVAKEKHPQLNVEVITAAQTIENIINDPMLVDVGSITVNQSEVAAIAGDINAYFGFEGAARCNLKITDNDMTAEEILSQVAESINCKFYRDGAEARFVFFGPQSLTQPRRSYTARQALDQRWKRSRINTSDYDGFELEYFDLDTNSNQVERFPESARQYQKLSIPGIATKKGAQVRVRREWNVFKLKRLEVEFTLPMEASLLFKHTPISVAKTQATRANDGYILRTTIGDGPPSVLFLSQPLYTGNDGLERRMIIRNNKGVGYEYTVNPLNVNAEGYATTVQITAVSDPSDPERNIETSLDKERSGYIVYPLNEDKTLMIVDSVSASSDKNATIRAFNYSDGYFANDLEFSDQGAFSNGFSDGFQI